jgi:tetratricopeptide (TPR) repeat protein
MRRNLLAIVILLFTSTLFYTQNSKERIDSLYHVITGKNAFTHFGEEGMLLLCTEMYYQSKTIGYQKGQLNAVVEMASVYNITGKNNEGLKKISEGEKLAVELKDYHSLSKLTYFKGKTFVRLGFYEKARHAFNKTISMANQLKNTDQKHIHKAQVYGELSNLFELGTTPTAKDSMVLYSVKAYEEAKEISLKNVQRNSCLGQTAKIMGAAYLHTGKTEEGEKYLTVAEQLLQADHDQKHLISLYRFRGELEYKKHNNQKASEYYQKAIDLAIKYKSLDDLQFLYGAMADISDELQDYKTQAEYTEKAGTIRDSINAEQKAAIINSSDIIAKGKEAEQSTNNNSYVLLWIFLLIVFTVFIVFLFKRYNGQKKLIVLNKEQSSEQTDFLNSDKISQLIELANSGDSSFYFKFLEVFPNFSKKLLEINPQITTSDLEFAALLKLNFDNKQIASFKNLSIRSVESKKYRLRKKLGVLPEENFYIWLIDK